MATGQDITLLERGNNPDMGHKIRLCMSSSKVDFNSR